MKAFSRWMQFALVVLAFILGIWFALENSVVVPVTLVGLALPSMPLGVWLLVFGALGVLVGFILSSLSLFRLRRQLKSRDRHLALCEKELTRLRTQPLRD
jgi:uncharacterized integral membrane protein